MNTDIQLGIAIGMGFMSTLMWLANLVFYLGKKSFEKKYLKSRSATCSAKPL